MYASFSLRANEFKTLAFKAFRAYRVVSDKDIVIQVIHWPAFPPGQGIQSFGVVVPCIQRVNAKPNVTLTPLRSEGDQSTTYIIAGAILLLVITVGVILMKRRSLG